MAAAGFWDNQEKAQDLVVQLRRLNMTLKPLGELIGEAEDLEALIELAEEDESGEVTPGCAAIPEEVGPA